MDHGEDVHDRQWYRRPWYNPAVRKGLLIAAAIVVAAVLGTGPWPPA